VGFRELLRDALALAVPGSIEATRVWVNLNSIGFTGSAAELQEALSVARREGDRALEVRILVQSGRALDKTGRKEEARQELERALELCTQIGMLQEIPLVHAALGAIAVPGEREKHNDLAMEAARRLGMRSFEARAYSELVWAAMNAGSIQRAIECSQKAMDLVDSAETLAGAAWAHYYAGQYETAMELVHHGTEHMAGPEAGRVSDSQNGLFLFASLALFWKDPEVARSVASVAGAVPEPWEEDESTTLAMRVARMYLAVLTGDMHAVRESLGTIAGYGGQSWFDVATRTQALGVGNRAMLPWSGWTTRAGHLRTGATARSARGCISSARRPVSSGAPPGTSTWRASTCAPAGSWPRSSASFRSSSGSRL
jgi:hypothetical protein